jgi:oligoendopeptidase F
MAEFFKKSPPRITAPCVILPVHLYCKGVTMHEPAARHWDLSALYPALDAPELRRDLAAAPPAAARFRTTYHGRLSVSQLSAAELATAIEAYAAVQLLALRPYLYAQLLFSSDGNEPGHLRLLAEVRESWQQVCETTLFFELELLRLPG